MKILYNVRHKVKKILDQTGLVHNLSRQKFVVNYLQALVEGGKVHLSLDRTEWDFGTQQWNILMLTAYSHGVGMPIWWHLVANNSGNSSTEDRVRLLGEVVNRLGASRIGSLCGDRIGYK